MELNKQNFQVWFHNYSLKRKTKPNARTKNSEQLGALIKIQDSEGNEGFSDLCPWPSLGDHPLAEELVSSGPLFRHALELAVKDLTARKNKIHLVSPVAIKNNILIADFTELKNFDFCDVTVKIKGNEHTYDLARLLNENRDRFFKIRLDFNFCLSENQFSEFLHRLEPLTLKKIEYVEDPFQFHRERWNKYAAIVPLALDWKTKEDQIWDFRIWKPSRETKPVGSCIVLTSAMEHPVGLAHGLSEAQRHQNPVNGFLTLDQYETTEFHQYFSARRDELVYQSDGYGIGFESLLSKINWIPCFDGENFLLSNPRLSAKEKKELFQIKKQFTEITNSKDYILIPSSGTTQSRVESVKVIALKSRAIVNSAQRVNKEFNGNESSVWGCVLPLFHVGGLGMYIRAELAHAKIYFTEWDKFSVQWLNDNQVTHLSLVPTQIFEIVQKKLKASPFLKTVFVGGATLSFDLAERAEKLGWPLIQTFGMTETASMVSVKRNFKDEFFETLPGVQISTDEGRLKIKADSNASYALRLNTQTGQLIAEEFGDWISTADQVHIEGNNFKFLQRDSDYIKIKGEGVSLFELREKLHAILLQKKINPLKAVLCDFSDERDGSTLRLVVSENVEAGPLAEAFNQLVRPYEKITGWIEIAEIPVSDLKKIKYNQIKAMKDLHVKKI